MIRWSRHFTTAFHGVFGGHFCCGDEIAHRKQSIEDRLQELAGIFALDVCGFAIMDNRLHVLLRLDLVRVKTWSAKELVERWIELCPLKDHY